MLLIRWSPVDRKRRNDIQYSAPEYVVGYDLDMDDFSALVDKYNTEEITESEKNRLHIYVLTMLQIVTENPKINPKPGEIEDLVDAMYLDAWNALHYIKKGVKPYSYIYRAAYTSACRFYKQRITNRNKELAILSHLMEEFNDYKESISDHRVRTVNIE